MSDKLAWAKALDELLVKRVEKVPPDFKAPEQLAEELGLCYEMTKIKCHQLVKAGLAERRDFSVKWGRGIRRRPFYRLLVSHKKT